MKPQQYIEEQLANLKKPVVHQQTGNKLLDIYQMIMSKKFRKYAVPPEFQLQLKNIIAKNDKDQTPIQFVWVFGGYKLWSLHESPEVDWAELFSFIYFVNWLKPVVAIHKPGVVFDFFSDDVIVPFMNNVPQKDTLVYGQSFKNLLDFIKIYLPQGFTYSFHRVEDQYKDRKEFDTEINNRIKEMEKNISAMELTEKQKAMIDLNVVPNIEQQKDPQWQKKVQIIHDAYSKMEKRRPYYRNPDKIMVLNTPISGALAVGTTKTSVVKFWVGVGALEKREDRYIERILSPNQTKNTKFVREKITIRNLEGKNFKTIRIIT